MIRRGVAKFTVLPYIMEFNIPACPERFVDVADAMGIERESMSDEQYALKAVEYESFEQKIKHSYNKRNQRNHGRRFERSRKDLLTMFIK